MADIKKNAKAGNMVRRPEAAYLCEGLYSSGLALLHMRYKY